MTAVDPRTRADDWLLAFQRVAERSIAISVTRRCPLACDHCITSSSRAPELTVLAAEQAERWAGELPALAAAGLRHLTFTGGEPTLAAGPVARLATAARAVGIGTAIVSSGAFATTERAASRMVERLEAVDRWDLGFDEFHEAHLPFAVFVRAASAIAHAAKPFCVRVCVGADPAGTEALIDRIRSVVPDGTEIITQPVRALGRATGLEIGRRERWIGLPSTPCVSSGLQVHDDGTPSPCCAGYAHADPGQHPFRLQEGTGSLAAAWAAWHDDQLLRTIRVLGFAPVVAWLVEAGVDPATITPGADVCEFCVHLWEDPARRAAARARADEPIHRSRLDAVEAALTLAPP